MSKAIVIGAVTVIGLGALALLAGTASADTPQPKARLPKGSGGGGSSREPPAGSDDNCAQIEAQRDQAEAYRDSMIDQVNSLNDALQSAYQAGAPQETITMISQLHATAIGQLAVAEDALGQWETALENC